MLSPTTTICRSRRERGPAAAGTAVNNKAAIYTSAVVKERVVTASLAQTRRSSVYGAAPIRWTRLASRSRNAPATDIDTPGSSEARAGSSRSGRVHAR